MRKLYGLWMKLNNNACLLCSPGWPQTHGNSSPSAPSAKMTRVLSPPRDPESKHPVGWEFACSIPATKRIGGQGDEPEGLGRAGSPCLTVPVLHTSQQPQHGPVSDNYRVQLTSTSEALGNISLAGQEARRASRATARTSSDLLWLVPLHILSVPGLDSEHSRLHSRLSRL